MNSSRTSVIIGAGFDSRAYRLKGGTWIELDEPQVIAYKDERLPISMCQNTLYRIPIDFSSESLEGKLASFAAASPVVVVIEGVFMYLEEQVIRELLQTLRRRFPQHLLICDLMSRRFFEKHSRTLHEKIAGLGTSFAFTVDDPEAIFRENGYRRLHKISVVGKAVEYKLVNIPRIIVRLFLRTLKDGYGIYVSQPQ
jgi:methyltransferase (TIGR00027 family)